jgi:hypothetical protein
MSNPTVRDSSGSCLQGLHAHKNDPHYLHTPHTNTLKLYDMKVTMAREIHPLSSWSRIFVGNPA